MINAAFGAEERRTDMDKKFNIVVLDGNTTNPGDLSWSALEEFGSVTVYDRSTLKSEVIERGKDADMLLTNKSIIDEEVMRSCPKLKYIGVIATGYNVVDLQYARSAGITVTNAPAYSTEAVVQMVFALLFEITNKVALHNAAVKNGEWANSIDFTFWKTPLISIAGKTLGIVGYGEIGRSVCAAAKAFGMNVLVNTRTPSKVNDPDVKVVSLDELYAQSDIVSLHCPLTDVNKGMISAEAIRKMKDGVIILNTARGPLVNERDLADALKSGKVFAAGCDVVSKEPMSPDNPLLECENCIITPHIAWAAKETRQKLIDIVANNIRCYLNGKPQNVVN